MQTASETTADGSSSNDSARVPKTIHHFEEEEVLQPDSIYNKKRPSNIIVIDNGTRIYIQYRSRFTRHQQYIFFYQINFF